MRGYTCTSLFMLQFIRRKGLIQTVWCHFKKQQIKHHLFNIIISCKKVLSQFYSMERNLCHYSSNKSSVLQINTICFAKNSIFKQTQTDLQIQNSIWEKMQRYGQICIVCYNCETHLPFYDQMWLDFLTNACRQIFSHVFKQIFSQMRAGRFSHMCSNWFSHKCNPNSRWRCWSIYAKHRFTFSRNTADQHEWGTGEFLSYYFYN